MSSIQRLLLVCCLVLVSAPAAAGWSIDDAMLPDGYSFKVEHRTRYERLNDPFQTPRVGESRDESTSVMVHRTLLHGRIAMPAGFSIGAELMDSRTSFDGDTVFNSTIVNPVELLRAYLEYRGEVDGGRLAVRAGRITMDVGSRRLVARNRFRNTINGFTGVDVEWQGGEDRDGLTLRAFLTLPVQREPNPQNARARRRRYRRQDVVFDTESFDVAFWGVFAARDYEAIGRVEAFLFGLHESDDADRPTRNRQLYTPGFRVFRSPARGAFHYTAEAALQFGQSRANASTTQELDHFAWFVHSSGGYTFDVPWSPRLSLHVDYASGDGGSGDGNNERFDTLFGARRFDYGPTGIAGAFARTNVISPGVFVEIHPSDRLRLSTSVRTYWLASKSDRWGLTGVSDPAGSSGNHVGTHVVATIRWEAIPGNLFFDTGYAHLFDGEFMDNAPNSPSQGDSEYYHLQATIKF